MNDDMLADRMAHFAMIAEFQGIALDLERAAATLRALRAPENHVDFDALIKSWRNCICPLEGHNPACQTRRNCADMLEAALASQPISAVYEDGEYRGESEAATIWERK